MSKTKHASTAEPASSLTVRIPNTMKADLERIAMEQDRSLGSIVRLALRDVVEESNRATCA